MAIVKKYQAEVENIADHGEGVYTLTLKSLGRKFKFSPGQFLHIALDEYDPSMPWPESRCFSMQTSGGSETLKITYAQKGDFTSRMAESLEVGKDVQLKLPYGDLFEQEHVKQNTVFIAGGTGVTPYLSLFEDASFKDYEKPVLYLGLRSDKYNFYKNELKDAETLNNSLKVNLLLQDKDGILDIEQILKENGTSTSYFISGPPVMIKTFKNYLIENGVADCNVLTDDWE